MCCSPRRREQKQMFRWRLPCWNVNYFTPCQTLSFRRSSLLRGIMHSELVWGRECTYVTPRRHQRWGSVTVAAPVDLAGWGQIAETLDSFGFFCAKEVSCCQPERELRQMLLTFLHVRSLQGLTTICVQPPILPLCVANLCIAHAS